MPKSNYGGKKWSYKILTRFHEASPLKKIIDVGPGVGTYSQFRQPQQEWIGIEAWAPYVQKYELNVKYDKVIVSDIRYLNWSKVAPCDVCIFGDILEHMSYDEALETVDIALNNSRLVVVSLPLVYSAQGVLENNPFEIHVKQDWTNAQALEAFPDWCVHILESYIGVYVLSRKEEDKKLLGEVAHTLNSTVKEDPRLDLSTFKIVPRSEDPNAEYDPINLTGNFRQ